MKVRISYVVDVNDKERRAIFRLQSAICCTDCKKELANRSEIKQHFQDFGIVKHECGSLATEADHIEESEDCNARF